MGGYDNILLIAWGGPTEEPCPVCDPDACPGHAQCYVRAIVGDSPRQQARVAEVAAHYEVLGGISPFNALTFEQADRLREALRIRGVDLPLRVGMRNWTPYIKETMEQIARTDQRRTLAVILAPHQSTVSWERYHETVETERRALALDELTVDYLDPWYDHAGLVEAIAARIEEQVAALGADRFAPAALIFTAHGIPESAARDGRYVTQFATTARSVARRLGKAPFHLAYQSEPDETPIPWIGPNIRDKIRELAAEGVTDVVVAPIGFLCDHVEVLYDLDVEARQSAAELGVGFHRAATVGSHPAFIAMLADLIRKRIAA